MSNNRDEAINNDKQNDTQVAIDRFKIYSQGEFAADQDKFGNIHGRSKVSDAGLSALSVVSHEMNKLFQPILDKRKINYTKSLFDDAVQGNQQDVVATIKECPGLLLVRNKVGVFDHVKRNYQNVTVFESALMVGDADMCKALVPYFIKLKNGRIKMLKQIIHVFSENDFDRTSLTNKNENELSTLVEEVLKKHEERQEKNIYEFDAILDAISQATEEDLNAQLNHINNGSTLNKAVLAFRQDFTDKSLNESVYNPFHLARAIHITMDKLNEWENTSRHQLLWCQVLGYAQQFMTKCYMQAFCHGLHDLINVNKSETLYRSTEIVSRLTRNIIYLDKLKDNKSNRLGFDFAAFSYNGIQNHVFQKLPNNDVFKLFTKSWAQDIDTYIFIKKLIVRNLYNHSRKEHNNNNDVPRYNNNTLRRDSF